MSRRSRTVRFTPATEGDDGGPPERRPRLTREDVMTVAEAATLLGVSTRHVYVLASRGELPGARRLGSRVIVSRPALEAWLTRGA